MQGFHGGGGNGKTRGDGRMLRSHPVCRPRLKRCKDSARRAKSKGKVEEFANLLFRAAAYLIQRWCKASEEQGQSRRFYQFAFPSRRLSSPKLVQGERRARAKSKILPIYSSEPLPILSKLEATRICTSEAQSESGQSASKCMSRFNINFPKGLFCAGFFLLHTGFFYPSALCFSPNRT